MNSPPKRAGPQSGSATYAVDMSTDDWMTEMWRSIEAEVAEWAGQRTGDPLAATAGTTART